MHEDEYFFQVCLLFLIYFDFFLRMFFSCSLVRWREQVDEMKTNLIEDWATMKILSKKLDKYVLCYKKWMEIYAFTLGVCGILFSGLVVGFLLANPSTSPREETNSVRIKLNIPSSWSVYKRTLSILCVSNLFSFFFLFIKNSYRIFEKMTLVVSHS